MQYYEDEEVEDYLSQRDGWFLIAAVAHAQEQTGSGVLAEVEVPDGIQITSTGAIAQADTDKQYDEKDAFLEMRRYVEIAKENAANPDLKNVDLEDRLAYLQDRGGALSKIINIPEARVSRNLNTIEANKGSTDSHRLFSLIGIIEFIKTSANFQRFQRKMERSIQSTRTGFQRMRRIFAWDVSPRAEAAQKLTDSELFTEEDIKKLLSEDIEEKKKIIQRIIDVDDEAEMLEKLEPLEREGIESRLREWEKSMEKADSNEDISDLMNMRGEILHDLQSAVRSDRNIFFRIVYSVQDFFGIGTT
jgi:hypothetical protein